MGLFESPCEMILQRFRFPNISGFLRNRITILPEDFPTNAFKDFLPEVKCRACMNASKHSARSMIDLSHVSSCRCFVYDFCARSLRLISTARSARKVFLCRNSSEINYIVLFDYFQKIDQHADGVTMAPGESCWL